MRGSLIQDALVDVAHLHGYRAFHQRPGQAQSGAWVSAVQYDGKGFPDLVLAGPPGVHFVEVKGDGDRLRPDQAEWIVALRAGGASAWVCSGKTWRSGLALELLRSGAHVTTGPLDPADGGE